MLFFSFGEHQVVNTVRSPPMHLTIGCFQIQTLVEEKLFPRRFRLRHEWTAVSQHQLSASL